MDKAKKESKKIGLWTLLSLVIGSQIGSGIFTLHNTLAPFGGYAIAGWVGAGLGGISLALVYAELAHRYPKNGGSHAYVLAAFGHKAAFFTGWTYWLISSISTASVIAATVSYMIPIIGPIDRTTAINYQIILCVLVALLNLRGVQTAGKAEISLATIKVLSLTLIPLAALMYFNHNHIIFAAHNATTGLQNIGAASLLAFWSFIGLETATTPAESVANPKTTIPLAIITGTCIVLCLYLLNSIAMIGLISPDALQNHPAPYVLASQYLVGEQWSILVAIFAVLVCLSNINAWILASGQIALGIANDQLLPELFKTINRYGAPTWGIIISSALNIPFIIATANDNITKQISSIIEISVVCFIFIYAVCCLSLFQIAIKEKKPFGDNAYTYSIMAGFFCMGILLATDINTLVTAALFTVSGIPIYWIMRHNKTKKPTPND
tara:strand:- start:283 stop:1599 length:1317 start_codon:yes stop_codon:yes gene_type:complete